MCRLIGLAVFTFCLTAILVPVQLAARDDGRFANSPFKPWFDCLASGKSLCCSFADGSGIDINHFDGDAVKLAAEWSGLTTVEPATA